MLRIEHHDDRNQSLTSTGATVTYHWDMELEHHYLTAEQYPALAKIWDNPEDAVYDNL